MSTHIEINAGIVHILFDGRKTSVSADRIEAFAKVVEAAKVMADGVAGSPGRRSKATPPPTGRTTTKRRSRKPVSVALSAWMTTNPGWHSEKALLQTVISHEMTDANPKRALKIALGRQRNKVFADRGDGYWCLLTEAPSSKTPRDRTKKAKKGQRPKLAPVSRDTRTEKTTARWSRVSRDAVNLAAQNLLGKPGAETL